MSSVNIAGKKVPKAAVFVGGGAIALGAFLWWRHASAASSVAADQASADTTGTDTSGYDYSGDSGLYDSGSYDPYGSSGFVGGDPYGLGYQPVTPPGPGPGTFSSNAQWAQYAESQLDGVVNESNLSAALGKYLTGQVMNPNQKSLTDQAIAIAGYPPVSGPGGFPPAMHTGGGGGGGQTPPTQVTVPSVIGMEYQSAAKKLHNAGLVARRGVADVGTVNRQNPKAGTKVRKGSDVILSGAGRGERMHPGSSTR